MKHTDTFSLLTNIKRQLVCFLLSFSNSCWLKLKLAIKNVEVIKPSLLDMLDTLKLTGLHDTVSQVTQF